MITLPIPAKRLLTQGQRYYLLHLHIRSFGQRQRGGNQMPVGGRTQQNHILEELTDRPTCVQVLGTIKLWDIPPDPSLSLASLFP